MVKAYQEIVRASSRRDPASGRAQPLASTSTGAASPASTTTAGLAPPVQNGTKSKDKSTEGGGGEKKGRFHRLARLQIGGSSHSAASKRDKGKGKAGKADDDVDASLQEEGTVDAAAARRTLNGKGGYPASETDGRGTLASSHRPAYPHPHPHHHRYPQQQQFLAPPLVGPNGALMYPPPPPMGYPYPYPPPPAPPHPGIYPGYPYGPYPPPPRDLAPQQHYANGGGYSSSSAAATAPTLPPLSAAASSSAARTGTGASTSPTSPNTPTSAAHYYPYVASQPKRQQDLQSRDAMASPQSFRSRGSGGQGGGEDGDVEEVEQEALDESGRLVRNGDGGTDFRRGGARDGDDDHGDVGEEARESLGNGYANGFTGPLSSGRVISGSSAASTNPNGSTGLPPGAAPPLRSPPSIAPSHRSGRSLAATSHRSGRSRTSAAIPGGMAGPPPVGAYPGGGGYPYPYPPPPPGYPPIPPYGYPPYPGYGPPPPPPPPHMRLAPPSPAPTSSTTRATPANGNGGRSSRGPRSVASMSQASLAASSSRGGGVPNPAAAYPYPYYPPMMAHSPPPPSQPPVPLQSQVGSTYDPAVYAVAQNMERERERERLRLRTDLGQVSKGKERERLGTGPSVMNSRGQAKTQAQREDEGKMSVGIDFGTTFSGIAYGSSRVFDGQIRQILNWPGSYETYRKVPTCILYEQHDPSEEAKIVSWGLEAKNTTVREGFVKCEWFKLLLSPESLRSGVPDPWLPPLPAGKNVVDVIADFLRCIWRYARRVITEEIGSVVDLNAADVLLTVPAAWDAAACSLMRESALRAGLVQSSRGGDTQWRDRLQIITEPEAGAIHASTLATLHHLRPSQSFLLCDAGGGTVDTAVYKLMGQLSELEIAEMCVRSGANTGSLFVDLKFEELLRRILKDHPVHLEPASMATFIHAFAEGDKLAYHGTAEDDEAIFRFNCFNVEDSHDPSVGLEYGELAIPGKMLKTEVFDPIIDQVLELLSTQIAKIGHTSLDAIILVGGFSASEYLYTRVRQAFGADVPVVVRPQDCDTATLRGAARYGLGLKMGRGGGAVLRKGERLRSRFCKFIKDPHDSVFTAHLFVSNSEELYRYTDEGDLAELCRWTVDLAALPRFREIERGGGGYIEFDLGLQLDSAEVRGVLMTEDGIECGAATFEFLGT
ncbi:hypothetical protein C6P46_003882 [Rhodotorula mucilaginosa]|uniref:Actin-like ATPase domain-containing protein n=1 Tax=Rhodotorula mucilaginosa TaxID=5537 RepID=A0A9P7B722_RHOMI|nr:hypothetical protein C6P46_003882 [Rhodotorula mucilaginosa]